MMGVMRRAESISSLGLSRYSVFHCYWLHEFLTAPLTHGSVIHLMFNMLSLWILEPSVERLIGLVLQPAKPPQDMTKGKPVWVTCWDRIVTRHPDLATVVSEWERLPEAIKAGIMAMVKAART